MQGKPALAATVRNQEPMPKFHCTHCGQHIDAPEETAGTPANCPSCGGEILVPGIPLTPSPSSKVSKKASSGGNSASIISVVILVVFAAFAGLLGKSCARSIANKRFGTSRTPGAESVPLPPSVDELSFYDVAGLRIKLPSRPVLTNMTLPPKVQNLMKSLQVFEVKNEGATISVTHAIYKISEANLDGSADGTTAQVKSLPNATSFSSSKKSVSVAGLPGIQVSMNFRSSGHRIAQYSLVFARGNEMWQVQVVGDGSGDQSALDSLKDEVFSSISLK